MDTLNLYYSLYSFTQFFSMQILVYFVDYFIIFHFLEAGLMTAKFQTESCSKGVLVLGASYSFSFDKNEP
jgi:hypothetical protein